MKNRLVIRCDDYPYGDPRHLSILTGAGLSEKEANNVLRSVCWEIMKIFENASINYVWGCSPCLFINDDIQILNSIVKKGRLIMHGFDHGVSIIPIEEWGKINETKHLGGEFKEYKSKNALENDYKIAVEIMSQLKNYDPTIFIPPFNSYTQLFLDVISNIGVIKELMICQTEYDDFLHKFQHWDIKLSTSKEGKSYDSIANILKNWDDIILGNPDHICLHPIYDFIDNGDKTISMYKDLISKYNSCYPLGAAQPSGAARTTN